MSQKENLNKRQSQDEISPKKKKYYYAKFNDDWLKKTEYKSWLLKENEFTGKCRICAINFVVKHDGEKAVKNHASGIKHRHLLSAKTSSQLLSGFIVPVNSNENFKAAIAELASVSHSIRHQHTYNSTDCGIKLNCKIFNDSCISQKIYCGRTKATSLAENVLGPKAIELVLKDLQSDNRFFSISSDASNKGNVKLFPLIVTYFIPEIGLKNKILDFYTDDFEDSESITTKIIDCLNKKDLSLQNVCSYSADNAPVNYGKSNSVYQKLCLKNNGIIKANCNCHVIHNAARYACKLLPYDIETLINKIYAEFSISTVCVRELKTCYEYFNMEYSEIMKSVPTRWLSLSKAVDRIITVWPAIKLYFLQQGEENCDKHIWKFVRSQEHELENDLNAASIAEMYIYFISHFLNFMCNSLLLLENEKVTAIELHDIMTTLKTSLEKRITDNFFGATVRNCLSKQSSYEKTKFISAATQTYRRAIEYLSKFYNFEENPFKYMACLNLKSELTFDSILKICTILTLEVDEDKLYDEVIALNQLVLNMRIQQANVYPNQVLELWIQIFKSTDGITEIKKIVSKVLSIPVSNAFIERVFSIMGSVWRNERNKMRIELVKAELCTRINFEMNCQNFHIFLKEPEQKKLIECSINQTKYNFKT